MPIYQPVVPNDAWPERFTFSPAVRVGNLVFLSGTTGTDDQGNMVGPGDIVAQTRRIFEKFSLILRSVGGVGNIIETTDYVLSLADYKRTAALRRELFRTALAGGNRGGRERTGPRGCPDRNQGNCGTLKRISAMGAWCARSAAPVWVSGGNLRRAGIV
jgi:enamine deaminase RidA (YjgF/YER057c/UK114 family)